MKMSRGHNIPKGLFPKWGEGLFGPESLTHRHDLHMTRATEWTPVSALSQAY